MTIDSHDYWHAIASFAHIPFDIQNVKLPALSFWSFLKIDIILANSLNMLYLSRFRNRQCVIYLRDLPLCWLGSLRRVRNVRKMISCSKSGCDSLTPKAPAQRAWFVFFSEESFFFSRWSFQCSWIGILHHFWCQSLPFQSYFQLWKSKHKKDTLEVQRQSFSSYSFGLWKVTALWRHFTRCQEIQFFDNFWK